MEESTRLSEAACHAEETNLVTQLLALQDLEILYGYTPKYKISLGHRASAVDPKFSDEYLTANAWRRVLETLPVPNETEVRTGPRRGRAKFKRYAMIIHGANGRRMVAGCYRSHNDPQDGYWQWGTAYNHGTDIWWKPIEELTEDERWQIRAYL
jgi:hypothetical protein